MDVPRSSPRLGHSGHGSGVRGHFVRIRGQVQFQMGRASWSCPACTRRFPACPRRNGAGNSGHRRAVSEGLMAVDAQGRITLLNKTAESILNLQGRKVLGNVAQVLSPRCAMLRTLKTGQGYDNQEIVSRDRCGPAYDQRAPLINEEGKVCGVVASLKDPGQIRALVHSVTGAGDNLCQYPTAAGSWASCWNCSPGGGNQCNHPHRRERARQELLAGHSRRQRAGTCPCAHQLRSPARCPAGTSSLATKTAPLPVRGGAVAWAFEFAHGGTVFLTRSPNFPPPPGQTAAGPAIGPYSPGGGNEEIQVDVRIMAATTRIWCAGPGAQVSRRPFYRLNAFPTLPLRQRRRISNLLCKRCWPGTRRR